MTKTGFLIAKKPSTVHSPLLTTLENTPTGLPSATTVSSAWMKIPLLTMSKTTEKKATGRNLPFPVLNLFAGFLCMCLLNALSESDTMGYYVPEPKPDIWHYAGISLAANSIFPGWKTWILHRCSKPSTVLRLLSVNAVADTLENHNSGYHYVFKAWYSYFLKSLRNEVYLSCLDSETRHLPQWHNLYLIVKCKDWKSIHIGSGDATLFTIEKSKLM